MSFHCNTVDATVAEVHIDFFWDMMDSMNDARAGFSLLEDAHEEEVDDASAAFMAGCEL